MEKYLELIAPKNGKISMALLKKLLMAIVSFTILMMRKSGSAIQRNNKNVRFNLIKINFTIFMIQIVIVILLLETEIRDLVIFVLVVDMKYQLTQI